MKIRPIYVVLYRPIYSADPVVQRYGIRELVKVIVCDVSEWDAVFKREVLPFQASGGNPLMWELFTRQEDEPFREIAEQAQEGVAE